MEKFLQSLFDDAVAQDIFPGCCACILYHGVAYEIVSGYRSYFPEKEKNELTTYYDLASLSKVVATTMVTLQLVHQGVLHLDTPIQTYWKQCPWSDVSIRHLLTHTSGLQADLVVDRSNTKETILEKIMSSSRQQQGAVVYSDCGYIILQTVLETVCQESLDVLARRFVFDPLHMDHTQYGAEKALWKICAPTEYRAELGRILCGEVHDEKARQLGGIAGHAGVFSTIQDMRKFAEMMLSQSDMYLPYELKKECWTSQYQEMSIPRGLGFLCSSSDISDLISDQVAYHTGFCGNSILLDLKQQLAIIVLSNRVHPTRKNEKILAWRKTMHDQIIEELRNTMPNVSQGY